MSVSLPLLASLSSSNSIPSSSSSSPPSPPTPPPALSSSPSHRSSSPLLASSSSTSTTTTTTTLQPAPSRSSSASLAASHPLSSAAACSAAAPSSPSSRQSQLGSHGDAVARPSVQSQQFAEQTAFSEPRRFSRRIPILSRNSSSSHVRPAEPPALHQRRPSASHPNFQHHHPQSLPRSPSPLPAIHDGLATAESSPRGSTHNLVASPPAVLPRTQELPDPTTLSHKPTKVTKPSTTTTAAASSSHLRKPSVSQLIPSFDDKRRKLVRNLSTKQFSNLYSRGHQAAVDDSSEEKMHQTSSRLLRMTDDDRPFTRDFKDLFSTLMVSLPLCSHRIRFRQVEHTFTSDEAITNLGSLKFSQSNRMPDPKDPSRIVTTTTTTTFSMAKEMARSVCQKFLDARFIESADGKMDFSSKSAVWQLTPKGMHILQRFCLRNGIQQDHVRSLLESPRNTMKLVILEREADTDRLSHDQATIEVIFRRFAGITPNAKADVSASDSDSLNDYATGLVGVKMAEDRKIGDRTYKKTFTGKAATEWLMDCCTMVDRRETIEISTLFIEYGLISPVEMYGQHHGRFQASKSAIYYITERGQRIAGWIASPQGSVNGDATNNNSLAAKVARDGVVRDSNTNRMQVIVRDPALRLLFGEYLRHTHCEENLSFYQDVEEFLTNYRAAKRQSNAPKLEFIRETLAAAYSLYNAFLAPGSPCELNIDHSLRIALASRMTRAVGDDEAMIKSLDEVASLFEQAQTTVFKLMATDSVPKFSRDPQYASILRERNLDFGNAPQSSS